MTFNELENYFLEHAYPTYERNKYDEFLKFMNFSFDVPSIHITGTNGKGSTSNYIYNIYLSKGYKVGLYTSPYLTDVTEMISVNGKHINEEEYLSLFNEYKDVFEKYGISSFEMQTFIAYEYFKRNNLDLVIIEVGMGGFIDATNIITPVLSIITSISFEHTMYLGASLSEIAYNKSGIIKDEVPVLVGKLDESAMFAIRERAKLTRSKVFIVEDYHNEKVIDDGVSFEYRPYGELKLSTSALYEVKNASIAIEATKILEEKFPVDKESILKGLQSNLICRFERFNNILLDGAHNPEAMTSLCDSLSKCNDKPVHVLFACFKDKNIDSMFNTLGLITTDLTITTFDHKRARTEEDYFLYLFDYKFNEDWQKALDELKVTYPEDLILVTGSLAFVGLVRKYLKNAQ